VEDLSLCCPEFSASATALNVFDIRDKFLSKDVNLFREDRSLVKVERFVADALSWIGDACIRGSTIPTVEAAHPGGFNARD
jgi:hypothetical protein